MNYKTEAWVSGDSPELAYHPCISKFCIPHYILKIQLPTHVSHILFWERGGPTYVQPHTGLQQERGLNPLPAMLFPWLPLPRLNHLNRRTENICIKIPTTFLSFDLKLDPENTIETSYGPPNPILSEPNSSFPPPFCSPPLPHFLLQALSAPTS